MCLKMPPMPDAGYYNLTPSDSSTPGGGPSASWNVHSTGRRQKNLHQNHKASYSTVFSMKFAWSGQKEGPKARRPHTCTSPGPSSPWHLHKINMNIYWSKHPHFSPKSQNHINIAIQQQSEIYFTSCKICNSNEIDLGQRVRDTEVVLIKRQGFSSNL